MGDFCEVLPYLQKDKTFCFTYGDGVGCVDISASLEFHHKHGKIATLTGVMLPGRFGALKVNGDQILSFEEKPHGDNTMVNGGFFVLNREVFQYLGDDTTVWEKEPLENLASEGQLMVFRHHDFWHPMDTLRDKIHLEQLWNGGNPPWKTWE